MAIKPKNLNLVLVLIMFTVFVTLVTEGVDASVMKVWSGPTRFGGGFSTPQPPPSSVTAVHENGAYQFIYQGQDIFFFNEEACQALVYTQLHFTTFDCRPFGWKSLWIQC
ncbi:hypothetical protein MKX01_011025 [Papaver californicum]|nr:hypothetical protein MKX01_011025 [Papaver californicum]